MTAVSLLAPPPAPLASLCPCQLCPCWHAMVLFMLLLLAALDSLSGLGSLLSASRPARSHSPLPSPTTARSHRNSPHREQSLDIVGVGLFAFPGSAAKVVVIDKSPHQVNILHTSHADMLAQSTDQGEGPWL
eukprot:CAMPEP_0197936240 /NCGR_PEP_ID=MMETSP1439-20131203/114604_1 /TAXON_ID=66791 /ORGANISM="Gonyaulax spinifera, Strain CCMP409" /LENGTH=131 /DNA_ID=CAMNT_0043559203 /DNA_START=14 /DNA_END=407 /DNA_ORIENTATION=-